MLVVLILRKSLAVSWPMGDLRSGVFTRQSSQALHTNSPGQLSFYLVYFLDFPAIINLNIRLTIK